MNIAGERDNLPRGLEERHSPVANSTIFLQLPLLAKQSCVQGPEFLESQCKAKKRSFGN